MRLEKSVKLWICYWAERKECVCNFPPKPTLYSYSSDQRLAPVNQDKNLEIIFPTPIAQQSSHTSTSFMSMEPVFSPTLLHLFVAAVDSKLVSLGSFVSPHSQCIHHTVSRSIFQKPNNIFCHDYSKYFKVFSGWGALTYRTWWLKNMEWVEGRTVRWFLGHTTGVVARESYRNNHFLKRW